MAVNERNYRYGLNIQGFEGSLGVTRFTVSEGLSRSFSIEINFISASPIELASAIGVGGTLSIHNTDNEIVRYFNGNIAKLIATGTNEAGAITYMATFVPLSWFLSKRSTSRIYQLKSVQEILEEKFTLAGIPGDQYEFKLSEDHAALEYCTQYQESDLSFMHRIMDEEGLFYYFRHEVDKHIMVIADHMSAYQPLESAQKIYRPPSMASDGSSVSAVTIQQQAVESAVSMRDYNFANPNLRQEGIAQEGDSGLELYYYPGKFEDPEQGQAKAQRLLEKRQLNRQVLDIRSNYPDLSSGYLTRIQDHSLVNAEDDWLLVELIHNGVQTQAAGAMAGAQGNTYHNKCVLIPAAVQYRSSAESPRPNIYSAQTATVVGPDGEDIYTDEFGRVKVQFHWDRQGIKDENSSCWVRVSQSWAGAGWGSVAIPRIGQEVVVQFIDGDPDRPLVTGSLYDATRKMPYDLPEHKSKTVLKTNSTPEGGGFNELSFEDKKGEENIYFHAERNLEKRVKNDKLHWVGNDQHSIVKNDHISLVEGDRHHSIMGDNFARIDGNVSFQVGGDYQFKTGGDFAHESGGDVHIKSGANLILEAGTEITLKVGGNFIKIDSSGVTAVGGTIKLNSGGSAGSGKGVAIDEPLEALEAGEREAAQAVEPPEKPESYSPAAMTLKQAAVEGSATVAPCDGA